MKNTLGVQLSEDFQFDLQSSRKRLTLIEGFRLFFLICVFLTFLAFQVRESYFISLDLVVPIYGFLFLAFVINTFYILSFDRWPKALAIFTAFLFAFDNVFITALVYTTGSAESIFLFMYLVNIILTGLVFKRRGSLVMALFASISFSLMMILNPGVDGTRLYFTIGVNNLAFFAVALLSGYLSEQIGFMGQRIEEQEKDIKVLQDLNKLIVDSMPSGLLTFDRTGKIIHCNIAAQKILSDELKGKPVTEFFAGVLGKIEKENYIRNGRHRGDVVYVNKNGSRLTLGMTVSPLTTESGQSFVHILLFQDLT
ncbi:MAG: PAS domain-containing protein [Bdellovibrionales bacterium]|nr:PAS domain-containing protein [Bdellovibrionales bacterium]